jgi:FAD/FMN-containing dehydrogenase
MALEKKQLVDIFGAQRVLDDVKTLEQYAQDQSFAPRRMPDFVVFAESAEEVQQVVKLANETLTPVIPYSSGLNFNGAALPDHGGIILNLSRMNKILQIDEENWSAMVEPGVTFEQLQAALMEKGFRMMIPFGAAPKRSVLSSLLERDPVMAAPSFEYGNFLIMDTELVLPDGELFRTGIWCTGGKPGGPMGPVRNVIFRLWTGAQGTLGIMTKMGVQINPIVKERKIFFLSFNELSDTLEPLKRIQRREIGMECFLLNRFNLAALLSEDWKVPESFPTNPKPSESFENFKTILPPWVLAVCINGASRHPEEKIAYEVKALQEVCYGLNVELKESIPQVSGLNRVLLNEILHPWGILKKFNHRGSVHGLTFKSSLACIAELEAVLKGACSARGYSTSSMGGYIVPLERGRAVHCEFDLHCDLNNEQETTQVKDLWLAASADLINQGAYFDRPYGPWADMVYQRAGHYTTKLKEIKKALDPQGILNPGKLCF